MKRSSLKAIASDLRQQLMKAIPLPNAEKIAFEAFFRGAAARYLCENGLSDCSSPSRLGSLLPDVFPESPDGCTSALSEKAYALLSAVPTEMWQKNVQLIGQLYQYYNSDNKEKVFEGLKKNIKIDTEKLPAATQIFTPEWIVRYMTENTLGRVLAESCGYDTSRLEYYIPQAAAAKKIRSPEDITFLDPCMGSGNILVCAFEMFMELYLSLGYAPEQACKLILSRNLYGIDIDSRVRRIAHFALIMKAAEYSPEIFHFLIPNNLVDTEAIADNNGELFFGSELFGSLIRPTMLPEKNNPKAEKLYQLLTKKYSAVVTNPPYMSSSNMNRQLLDFIKQNYSHYRADLFSAFMVRCTELTADDGYLGFLTPYVWMFIKSYEELRKLIFTRKHISSLIQLEYSAFGDATVPLCAFTLKNSYENTNGIYFRLADFRGGLEVQRKMYLRALSDRSCGYVYEADSRKFMKIASCPAAYWVSDRVMELYEKYPPLGSIAAPRKGNSTSDNSRFLRLWFEVDKNKMNLESCGIDRAETRIKRWFPYNKGGGYRKWYGFNDYLIDWFDDAAEIRKIPTAVIANYRYFTVPGLTWSTLTSGKFSIRAFGRGHIFDNGGCCIFELGDKKYYICALLNSKVFAYIFGQLNPTLNFQSGEVAKFPFVFKKSKAVDRLAEECISISKKEYDCFETSRDFKKHPLL